MARSFPAPELPERSLRSTHAASITRAVVARGRAIFDPLHDAAAAVKDDRLALDIVTKGAIDISTTATVTALATAQLQTIATILGPTTASGQLLQAVLNVSLGRSTSLTVPSALATGDSFAFLGEGLPLKIRQYVFSTGPTLKPKKSGLICVANRELIEHSDAQAIITDLMRREFSLGLEKLLLDNVAGDTVRPAGLLNSVTPIAATANGGLTAMLMDIGALASACSAIGGLNLMFIAGPAAAVKIMVHMPTGRFPFPLAASSALSDTTIMCIALPGIIAAGGSDPVKLDVSREAVLVMSDTPTALTGNATATPVAAAWPVRSVFQQDAIAIRLLADLDWSVRAAGAVAVVNSISW